jgi:hypothetical protein
MKARTTKPKGFGIAAILAALLIAAIIVPSVGAQPVSEEVGPFSGAEMPEELKNAVRQVDPYTFVCGAHVPDKKAFVAAWEAYEEAARGEREGVGALRYEESGTDSATKNLLGSYIEGETYFHGIRTGLTGTKFTGDGHTKGWWWGDEPWTADKLQLDSVIVIRGLGDVSLSIPPGAGFSISGNTATYSGTWYDEWGAVHYYENLEATSLIAIVDEDQNDAETFRFGNEDHTLYTHVDLD